MRFKLFCCFRISFFLCSRPYALYRHRIGLVRLRSPAINPAGLSANLVFAIRTTAPHHRHHTHANSAATSTTSTRHAHSAKALLARLCVFFFSLSSFFLYSLCLFAPYPYNKAIFEILAVRRP